jgi:hypothetical protein
VNFAGKNSKLILQNSSGVGVSTVHLIAIIKQKTNRLIEYVNIVEKNSKLNEVLFRKVKVNTARNNALGAQVMSE